MRYAACGVSDMEPGGVDVMPPLLPDDAIAAYIAICDGNAACGPDGNGDAATASNALRYGCRGNPDKWPIPKTANRDISAYRLMVIIIMMLMRYIASMVCSNDITLKSDRVKVPSTTSSRVTSVNDLYMNNQYDDIREMAYGTRWY